MYYSSITWEPNKRFGFVLLTNIKKNNCETSRAIKNIFPYEPSLIRCCNGGFLFLIKLNLLNYAPTLVKALTFILLCYFCLEVRKFQILVGAESNRRLLFVFKETLKAVEIVRNFHLHR